MSDQYSVLTSGWANYSSFESNHRLKEAKGHFYPNEVFNWCKIRTGFHLHFLVPGARPSPLNLGNRGWCDGFGTCSTSSQIISPDILQKTHNSFIQHLGECASPSPPPLQLSPPPTPQNPISAQVQTQEKQTAISNLSSITQWGPTFTPPLPTLHSPLSFPPVSPRSAT